MNRNTSQNGPLLSVVIPYYNTALYLPECLNSVYNALRGIPSEMILVDDLSTDDSHKIVDTFFREHRENDTEAPSSIRFIHLTSPKASRGPGVAKNTGIEAAGGTYIGFTDSDDIVLPHMFRNMLLSIEHHKADLCVCDVSLYKKGVSALAPLSAAAFSQVRSGYTDLTRNPELIYSSITPDKICKKALLDQNKIRFEEDCFYEDMFTAFRMYCAADRIAVNRNIGYLWRMRESRDPSITQNTEDKQNITEFINSMKLILDYIETNRLSDEIRRTMKQRILRFSLGVYFNSLEDLPAERVQQLFREWKAFISEYRVLEEEIPLSLYDRQRYRFLMNGEYDSLIRLTVYKNKNYGNTPILDQEGEPVVKLNEAFFPEQDRSAKNEFLLPTPPCFLRTLETDGETLSVSGWLYCPRVNVPRPGDQEVNCFLLNDITGETLPLETSPDLSAGLTKKNGKIFNYDDYTTYRYNYDGCGFTAHVRAEDLLNLGQGPYLLMLEYRNQLIRGCRPLRRLSPSVMELMGKTLLSSETCTIRPATDERSTLILEVQRTDET